MTRSNVIMLALSAALAGCGSSSEAPTSAGIQKHAPAEAMAVVPSTEADEAVPVVAQDADADATAEPVAAQEAPVAGEPEVDPTAPEAPTPKAGDDATKTAAEGGTSELDDIISKIEARYGGIDALTARFVQTTRSSVFGAEEQGGALKVKRPSMMRWSFDGEGGKEFVTDGKTMWIYTRADNQVLKYEDVSSVKSQADNLLQSLDRIDEMFEVSLVDDGDAALHTLSLKPREGEAQFKTLRLVLDEQVMLKGLTMTDTFDNVTELAFSNVQLDAVLPASAFSFEVPEGAQVVDAGSL